MNEKQIAKCLKYSENPKALSEILKTVEITAEFVGVQKYFDDDTDKRAVYNITLKKGSRGITFTFGASLMDSVSMFPKSYDQKMVAKTLCPPFGRLTIYDLEKHYNPFNIKKAEKAFYENLPYSILSCVSSEYHCSKSFSDFCWDYGYDEDSRKAYKAWERCLEQSGKLEKLFTPEEIETLPS